jgi:hypothetical protein
MLHDANNIFDLSRRVEEVLTRNPRDHYYAGDHMRPVVYLAARIMMYSGYWSEKEALEEVREAGEAARLHIRELEQYGDRR